MKIRDILWILLISMLPIIELRGAIPIGAALGLPFYINYACAAVGNLLPIPFILLFIPKILDFLAKFKTSRPIVEWLRKKALKNSDKIAGRSKAKNVKPSDETMAELQEHVTADAASPTENEGEATANAEVTVTEGVTLENTKRNMPAGAFIGLMLFVLLPIPGTGAWTGSLVAALFNYPKKKSFLAITLGVIGCGVIMSLASYGVLGFLKFLL